MSILPFKFPSLLPKNDQFNVLIGQLASSVCACPRYLKIYVESQDQTVREQAGRDLIEARATSKNITAQITTELCRSYVTPFDRDDIQDFAASLYKIPKIIEKVKERLDLHGLAQEGGDFTRQIDVIVEESAAMEDLVQNLIKKPDSHHIQNKVTLLYDLEHKGDKILGELLGSLFKNQHEARALILRKDIYDMLEKVIDRYRDAAAVALQIVLKHG